jgi:hypothetical protein
MHNLEAIHLSNNTRVNQDLKLFCIAHNFAAEAKCLFA